LYETSAEPGLGRQGSCTPFSPLLFKRIKDAITMHKEPGPVLMRFNELRETLQLRLTLLRYAPGVMLSLQRRFSSTGLSSNSFPTWGFTGTGHMVLFDREREIYPSPQARRGPPAHD
jgi:hypothetical protein